MPDPTNPQSNSSETSPGDPGRSSQRGKKPHTLSPYTRRSFVRMFLLGSSVQRIVRFYSKDLPHRGGHAVVEQELREDMIAGGALERSRRPLVVKENSRAS